MTTAPTSQDGQPMGYADCMAEVQQILGELEGNAVDIDHLASKVKRASELLKFCNDRLVAVRADVTDVVEDLASDGSGSE